MCVKLDGLKLVPQGVFVVWDWEWSDSEPDSSESDQESISTYCSGDGDVNPYLQSEPEADSDAEVASGPLLYQSSPTPLLSNAWEQITTLNPKMLYLKWLN